ncbi:PqqD family protein [Novosphingobium sp. TH158]|uniref:PqqD family protein n=1 Tax=Novosphingobium sp. TH158 TaxID=2067455 RepID=UPI001C1FCA28|nr:PqqD family protein [Novosphingobium sp. TH158]
MAEDPCPTRRIICAPWVSWGPAGAEIVLFDSRSGSYHALNASATAIWLHLSAGLQPSAIAATIAAENGIPSDQAAADVDGFIEAVLAADLAVVE